jgi:preprotein translocase subunit Sec61beta
MADNKISMPQSGGGLIRYFDDYKSKIMLDKNWIMIALVVVIVVEILLQKAF